MFNRETEYALRALVYIQQQNDQGIIPGLESIAADIHSPRYFTAKILQNLVKKGFLLSSKGRGGGFYFDPEKPPLSLKVVVESIEGSRTFEGCGFGLNTCDPEHPCALHDRYGPIRQAIDALLSSETIQSLSKKKEGSAPI